MGEPGRVCHGETRRPTRPVHYHLPRRPPSLWQSDAPQMWQATETPWFFVFRHRQPFSQRRSFGMAMNDKTPTVASPSLAICVITVTVLLQSDQGEVTRVE